MNDKNWVKIKHDLFGSFFTVIFLASWFMFLMGFYFNHVVFSALALNLSIN